ncbi:MAG: type IV pili twitching motility protein PilT, partial [Planctomycetota bacterium]|nr:type IV pili twitching motility protein PilT [Planctomycetota bacterium]
MVTMEELLRIMIERRGSDLHISAGSPPRIRIHGDLMPTEHDVLDPEQTQKLVYSILDNEQIARFENDLELDMSFGIAGIGRFRTNVFMQRGAVGAAIRVIPYEIASFEQLGLPRVVCEKLCNMPKGLV